MATVTPGRFVSGGELLFEARDLARGRAWTIDRLYLDAVKRGIPGIEIHDRIVSARAGFTIEGASTLRIGIHDPEWLIEASQLLAVGADGRMRTIEVVLDKLTFRLVEASRQDPETLELTFEDRVVSQLRQHKKHQTWRRSQYTRAQVIGLMLTEGSLRIPFFSPERDRKQPVASPDYPDARPPTGETGFDDGAKFKIKGQWADAQQMREVATALKVADQLNATKRVKLALLVAGIGESAFVAVPNAQGSGYAGVFQADPKNIPMKDTEQQARYFLKGGKGFQAGGAIKLAQTERDISPGEIATRVEASGQPGSFYDKYRAEADKILGLWQSADGADDDSVTYYKQYQFMRGYPDGPKGESSWDAMVRLADEVRWRVFAFAGVVYFVSDDSLITSLASVVLDDPLSDGLLERPTYDWDHGKQVGTVEMKVHADRWELQPGSVVALVGDKWGPISGRWIIREIDQNLLDPLDCAVTLTKPMPALKEPAPEIDSHDPVKSVRAKIGASALDAGARGIVEQCVKIAQGVASGIVVASAYRPRSITTSGNVSDHSENNSHRAARDIAVDGIDAIKGPPSPKLDKAVLKIGDAFKRNYTLGETIIDTFNWKGYRIQVIWRTPLYGGHMGHIHVGALKVSDDAEPKPKLTPDRPPARDHPLGGSIP